MNPCVAACPKRKHRQWQLLLIALPLILLIILFNYVPIGGWILALYDYHAGVPLFQNTFVGLKYFHIIFTDPDILNALKNTLIFNGIAFALSPLPMLFAIALNEIGNTRFRKFAQTMTTLPNFISWIIVYSLAFAIFSNDGIWNRFIFSLGVTTPNRVLTDPNLVYAIQTAIGQWKSLGWKSIIYIAAIAGIDQEQYEAAVIDGAGRFRSALHITLPGLMPTFVVLLLIDISNILNTGVEQMFVFRNSLVADRIETLDLYIYRMGLQVFDYAYATAVGIIKSLFSITMLFIANQLAKKVRGTPII